MKIIWIVREYLDANVSIKHHLQNYVISGEGRVDYYSFPAIDFS